LRLAAGRFDLALLLNRQLVAFGHPKAIFTEERLQKAYGSHLHMVQTEKGMLLLDDTCCDN
jgi:ABC-type Mn2+/Zn2+ transport system ATPase subunit